MYVTKQIQLAIKRKISMSKIARRKNRKSYIYSGYPLDDESQYEPTERMRIAMEEGNALMREYEERKRKLKAEESNDDA